LSDSETSKTQGWNEIGMRRKSDEVFEHTVMASVFVDGLEDLEKMAD